MKNETHLKVKKKPTLLIALIPILVLIGALGVFVMKFDQDPHIPLIIGAVVAGAIAILVLNDSWDELEAGILATINMGMQACIILMIIGGLIGTWIASGVVPTLIYYGLKIISPKIFLAATMVICSIVAISTGSSWTTAGTIGVALIGVGSGLGFPVYMTAGAIISGGYFGDKMSPLSDTTNLAPSMAGASLFDHIQHMLTTTGPSYVIALILYAIIGFRYAGDTLDMSKVDAILEVIESNFTVTPLLLLPPLLVIAMVVFKVPAIPGLIGGAAIGVVFAVLVQGVSFETVMDVTQNGFTIDFGENATEAQSMVKELLERGGIQSMMWTVSLIICALSFGGIMERTGMLEVIAQSLLKFAVNTGMLVLITIISSIVINIIAADQYLAIVIPGRMYKDAFASRRLAPKNLSRTLEDGGTLTSPLVPWNTCGAFMSKALGVPTFQYLPWCFLNLINPVISTLWAFLGLFQTKMTDEEYEAYLASKAEAQINV